MNSPSIGILRLFYLMMVGFYLEFVCVQSISGGCLGINVDQYKY